MDAGSHRDHSRPSRPTHPRPFLCPSADAPGLWRTDVWFLFCVLALLAVAAFCVCLFVCTLTPQSLPCRPAGRWQDRRAVDRQGMRSVPLCLRMGTLLLTDFSFKKPDPHTINPKLSPSLTFPAGATLGMHAARLCGPLRCRLRV